MNDFTLEKTGKKNSNQNSLHRTILVYLSTSNTLELGLAYVLVIGYILLTKYRPIKMIIRAMVDGSHT